MLSLKNKKVKKRSFKRETNEDRSTKIRIDVDEPVDEEHYALSDDERQNNRFLRFFFQFCTFVSRFIYKSLDGDNNKSSSDRRVDINSNYSRNTESQTDE